MPYSRTNFFVENGEYKGFEFELFREFEKQLNKSRQRGQLPVTIIFELMPVSELVESVADGTIDIAAGIVITEERQKQVQFTNPYTRDISAIVVSGTSYTPSTVDDLSGKSVLLNRGSSYPGIVQKVNQELIGKGLKPVEIELVDTLETEDIFELINSGAIDLTVAHEHLANLWKAVYPNIMVHSKMKLGDPAKFAWAIRKQSPQLLDALNAFISKNRQGTLVGNVLLKRYFKDTDRIANPFSPDHRQQISDYAPLFKKYGEKYGINWIFLAATAYQESKFQAKLRSPAGAVGLMQIRPETASEVGIKEIENPDRNVEAAAKYFALLEKNYLNDGDFHPIHKLAMISASYNAGPTRIRQLRKEAARQGLNPNEWYGSVELLALKKIGLEPVRYVKNVAKYDLCFQRILLTEEERKQAAEEIQ
jgi:membrane-bound lytic murein transglycosylase MltF